MTERVWKKALDTLFSIEGGYVNDPRDSGGETKYGISKNAHPEVDIPSLTLWQAEEIYRKDYWFPSGCDKLPDYLSVAVFDFAVNSNPKRAVQTLQKVLRVKADGIVGNQTIAAADSQPPHKVLDEYINARLEYLMKLKKWAIYGKGWGNRLTKVQSVAESLI